jgi:hypothetical protein
MPYEGSRIDESQIFILGLDAPVKPETIVANAHCVAAGVNEQIGVRLVTGDERKAILDNRRSFASSYLRLVLLDEGAGRSRNFLFRLPVTGSDQEKFLRLRDAPESPLVTLACARTLPADAEVKLVWGRGIAATTGVATTQSRAIAFRVRPAFRASFTCDRVNKDAQCIPILPMTLNFSAPISMADAAKIQLVDAGGKATTGKAQGEAGGVTTVTFGPGLPEKQRFRIELPADLKDDAGRALSNARSFPLTVRTDENPPLVKFAADFGILERVLPKNEKPMLPVTVRNVEPTIAGASSRVPVPGNVARVAPGDDQAVIAWFRRLAHANRIEREYDDKTDTWTVKRNGYATSIFNSADAVTKIQVPKPLGTKAFEVVGIPLAQAGFYVVELASPKLGAALIGNEKTYHARAATLVTNLSVHVKLGRESSLVWVTRLADATVVPNAAVAVRDCRGTLHWEGRTDASGIARIAKALPERDELPACAGEDDQHEYFVTARTADDMAFAFTSWGEGITPWRYNVPTARWDGPFVAHAVMDRTLVRTGETVSMKVFVRRQTGSGFALVARDALDGNLVIRHVGSDKEYAAAIRWNGAATTPFGEASFAVPGDAFAGSYQVLVKDKLSPHAAEARERLAGTFRVEAFRVPLLRARMQALGTPLVRPKDVSLDLQINYLSGGGAANLPVTLRTIVESKSVAFGDYEDYAFAAGDVREGHESYGDAYAQAGAFTFADPDVVDESGRPVAPVRGTELALALDAAGGGRATVKDVATSDQPQDLVAELDYRDPNGETLTASTRVALWPASIVLGLKPDSWVASKDKLKFTVVAVDLAGKPVAGVRVRTDAFKRESYSHRRRLIGGFYAYEHGYDTTRVGDLCTGTTDSLGLLDLRDASPGDGQPDRARAGGRRRRAAPSSRAPTRGSRRPTTSGSPRRTTTASTCSPRRSATTPARPRASRCARRSAKRPRWSRSSAKACSTRSSPGSIAATRSSTFR